MSLSFGRILFVLASLVNLYGSSKINTIQDLVAGTKLVEEFNHNLISSTISVYIKKTVRFWMYSSKIPDERLKMTPEDVVWSKSYFDGNQTTKILIHGWLGNAKDQNSVCTSLKNEYFKLDDYYNVICVDWSLVTLDTTYLAARLRCKEIGNYVAKLIAALLDNTNLKLDRVHVIGFSMGAHIAGYAGKQFMGRIPRITGLDPAKPLFFMKRPRDRLSKGDAQFVDVLHTTVRILGQHQPLGDVDFYPNEGNLTQPGCRKDSGRRNYIYTYNLVMGDVCSHFMAYKFYARSISNRKDFVAVKCDGWKQFVHSDCDKKFTYMGEYVNSSSITGKYYLSVLYSDNGTV
ncbi:Lipase/vitellogenin,Triacylglycerol lipase family,Lipase, N-terminal,Alpha/Beta hydrolase fold [Cinara cedri]|uniref:Lipase/vitellogenin,Triacylglycerol lipase family,Lipase, N-terminal,Alpha/Beta hydrolase fold n=1 Tax=Cinara cedri TaxID=506608 RepID=A0A5E4NHF3_9HEMI|nr:Lipase/vitellogenin,Triacylglycerol lipase family,Lipase, N-terminal,Alpha/Beta hydrolase fold [Cinara cedri]